MALALLALVMAAAAADVPFAVHMGIVAAACLIALWVTVSRADFDAIARGILKMPGDEGVYDDDPIRWGRLRRCSGEPRGWRRGSISRSSSPFPRSTSISNIRPSGA